MAIRMTGIAIGEERARSVRAVRLWLFAVALLIVAMIIVGGAVRLTDSGLSITEWKPLLGALPPLTEADWRTAFERYRQIPEYSHVNQGMTLAEFKPIYWWEWAHRFLGRFIGLAVLVPFVAFWALGRLPRGLALKLVLLFVLGGLQGALGWYMVTSGLVDRVDVSQYRLAAHLSLAVAIFGYAFWLALDLGPRDRVGRGWSTTTTVAAGLVAMIFLQIALGGLVAGLDAGQGYNTWPLMDGRLVPEGLGAMTPWHLNLFENAMTVQFNHRLVAYGVVAAVVLNTAWLAKHRSSLALGAALVAILALAQAALGVVTLLNGAPLGLSLSHQALAIALFASAVLHLWRSTIYSSRLSRSNAPCRM